jgi:UDP-N-acetylmuramoyl-tripeptide--D-alanyl-D-alanine ligase
MLFDLFLQHRRVCTDTRKLQPGDIYFALKGANFDGNAFAKQALDAGASAVVIDDPRVHKPFDERYMLMGDALEALQDLAYAYRNSLTIPIIGLGGSNGKTTTKELLVAAFQGDRKVHATAGNFNNHIGVPLTLLAIPQDAELAIIEMSTNQPGDMVFLSALARPDVGLLTNIGKEHLELLRDLDGVQEEEGALFRFLEKNNGLAFVNMADDRIAKEAKGLTQKIEYGTKGSQAWFELNDMQLDSMELELQGSLFKEPFTISSSLSGIHNSANILAAAVVASHFGVPPKTISAGIAPYKAKNNRSEVTEYKGLTIWMDAYNANPSSMEAAIAHVCSTPGKRVALVLGDMRELGESSEEEHASIGRFIKENHRPAVVVGIGPEMKHMVEEAPDPHWWFPDVATAKGQLWGLLEGVDTVLIKASRGMRLEGLMEE